MAEVPSSMADIDPEQFLTFFRNNGYIEGYLVHSVQPNMQSSTRSILQNFFKDIDIEHIDAEKFLRVLNVRGTKNLTAIVQFIADLDRNGIIQDPQIKRLALHSDAFGGHTPRDFVYALFNSPDYEIALESGMLVTHEGRMLFLASYKGTHDIDMTEHLRLVCNTIIHDTVFDESHDERSRWEEVQDILAVIKTFIPMFDRQITPSSIVSIFENTEKVPKRAKRTGKQFGITMRILSEMDKRKYIDDQGLQHFLRELYPVMSAMSKSGTPTSRSMEEYLQVLSTPRIDLWDVLYPPKYKFPLLILL